MVQWLALAVLSFGLQGTPAGEKTLLQQVIPNPTGQNGYEEYLQAAEVVRNGKLNWYLSWTPTAYKDLLEASTKDKSELAPWADKPSQDQLAFYKRLDGMTRLQVWREAVSKFGTALDYIAKGNRKRVWDPRTNVSFDSLYPEFAYLKSVVKVADMAAFVAFADGNSKQGTKYLLDGYQLGVNLESGIMISHLVGIALEAISLAGIERHLDSISRADAALIEATVPTLLSGSPRILKCVDYEQRFFTSGLEELLRKGEGVSDVLYGEADAHENEYKSLEAQLKAMSPQQRDQLLTYARSKMQSALIPVRKKFQSSESDWMSLQTTRIEDAESDRQIPQNPREMVDQMVSDSAGLYDQAGQASAKARTQLRLLGLSASIIRYKWDNGRLPGALEDAVGANGVKDPLSGDKFVYERQGAWGFRVYSRGTPALGEIGLKYRRTISQDSGPAGTPPPIP